MSKDSQKIGLVEVTVNNVKIKIHSPATGLEVKQAAIDAGVRIKLDFILELEKGDEAVQIGDDEKIEITEGASFTANDGDDNS